MRIRKRYLIVIAQIIVAMVDTVPIAHIAYFAGYLSVAAIETEFALIATVVEILDISAARDSWLKSAVTLVVVGFLVLG